MVVTRPQQRYPTDLTDDQWNLIKPHVRATPGPDRPRTIDNREVVNAIFYLNRTGCQWEMLPNDFLNHNSVCYYFDKWTHDGNGSGSTTDYAKRSATNRGVIRNRRRPSSIVRV